MARRSQTHPTPTHPAPTQPAPPVSTHPTPRPTHPRRAARTTLASHLTALVLAIGIGWSISPTAGITAAVIAVPAGIGCTAYALTRRPAGRHRAP